MTLKPGVRVLGIKTEMLLGLIIADGVFRDLNYEMVVTSVVDGKHSRGSLHYAGCAVDLRVSNVKLEDRPALRGRLKGQLGDDFDVVLEPDHFHLEYQPKEPY